MPNLQEDIFFMQLAYQQACLAFALGEVPVGAVLVQQGQVIAQAHNSVKTEGLPTAHAEMKVLNQGARHLGDWRLNALRLYVTKEPCPMCAGALIMARVGEVVFGVPDPKMGCLGGALALEALPGLNHHLKVRGGVYAQPCQALLQDFFRQRRMQNKEKKRGLTGQAPSGLLSLAPKHDE